MPWSAISYAQGCVGSSLCTGVLKHARASARVPSARGNAAAVLADSLKPPSATWPRSSCPATAPAGIVPKQGLPRHRIDQWLRSGHCSFAISCLDSKVQHFDPALMAFETSRTSPPAPSPRSGPRRTAASRAEAHCLCRNGSSPRRSIDLINACKANPNFPMK